MVKEPLHLLQISNRLWRTTSWGHRMWTSIRQVRSRPKRPATALAAELSSQTQILNSEPESLIAHETPNASPARRTKCIRHGLAPAGRDEALGQALCLDRHPAYGKDPTTSAPPTAANTRPKGIYISADNLLPHGRNPRRDHNLRGNLDTAGNQRDPLHVGLTRRRHSWAHLLDRILEDRPFDAQVVGTCGHCPTL